MSDASSLLDALPDEALWRLEDDCRRFERAWLDGRRPLLEDFLPAGPPAERLALLRELLRLELYYRNLSGEHATPADYETRFPDATEVVRAAFEDLPEPPPTDHAPDLDAGHASAAQATAPFAAGGPPLNGRAPSPTSRFRIRHYHDGGNLGEIFLAEDTELHRDVALKRIRPNLAGNPDMRARLFLEGEVTGRLEHPGVVPVYGLGLHADGQPYYAMRFIRGEDFAEAIRRLHAASPVRFDGLEFRELLTRFVTVCQAVAYAHSRGVLHRDLKPGNIRLGKYGETLVLDWGLLKVLGPAKVPEGAADSGQESVLVSSAAGEMATRDGSIAGTPAYMSPEQARGEISSLGPATDVYALGAILYQMLANKPPREGPGRDVIDRAARGEYRPLAEASPRAPRALAAVCARALAPRPEDRYASALDLAGDLQAWLADEPVSAYREPWPDRLRRWMRKHPRRVTAAGVALLAVLVALVAGTAFQSHANSRLAAAYADASDEQDYFLREVGDAYLFNAPNMEPLQQSLLQEAIVSSEELLKKVSGDPRIRRRRAEAYRQHAELNTRLGRLPEAEGNASQAIGEFEALLQDQPGDRVLRLGLARACRALADVQARADRPEQAQAAADRALGLVEALIAAIPTGNWPGDNSDPKPDASRVGRPIADEHGLMDLTSEYRLFKGQIYDVRAAAREEQGQLDAALADTQSAIAALVEAYEFNITMTATNRHGRLPVHWPGVRNRITTGGFQSGLYTNFFIRQGRAIEDALTGATLHRARLLRLLGRLDEADAFLKAVTLALDSAKQRPHDRRANRAAALLLAGQVSMDQGRPAQATPLLREARDLFTALREETSFAVAYRDAPSLASGCLGENLLACGQTGPAADFLRQAIPAPQDVPGAIPAGLGLAPDPPPRQSAELGGKEPRRALLAEQARFLQALGCLESDSGRVGPGLDHCRQALALQTALLDRNPRDLGLRRAQLATREALVRMRLRAGELTPASAAEQQQALLDEYRGLVSPGQTASALRREAVAAAAQRAEFLLKDGRSADALRLVDQSDVLPTQESSAAPAPHGIPVHDLRQIVGPLAELGQRKVGAEMPVFAMESDTPSAALSSFTLRNAMRRDRTAAEWPPWAQVERQFARPAEADLRLLARLLGLKAAALAAIGEAQAARVAVGRAIVLAALLAEGDGAVGVPPSSWPEVWSLLARQLTRTWHEPGCLYDLAVYLTLALSLPGGDPAADPAGQAVKTLQSLAAAGFDNAALLRADPRLAALRERDDFRKLVQTIEATTPTARVQAATPK